jgi:hypothetical protein
MLRLCFRGSRQTRSWSTLRRNELRGSWEVTSSHALTTDEDRPRLSRLAWRSWARRSWAPLVADGAGRVNDEVPYSSVPRAAWCGRSAKAVPASPCRHWNRSHLPITAMSDEEVSRVTRLVCDRRPTQVSPQSTCCRARRKVGAFAQFGHFQMKYSLEILFFFRPHRVFAFLWPRRPISCGDRAVLLCPRTPADPPDNATP